MARCRWEIYRDTQGFWRWRLIAKNGRIIADGGEGYYNRTDAVAGIRAVCNCCSEGDIVDA